MVDRNMELAKLQYNAAVFERFALSLLRAELAMHNRPLLVGPESGPMYRMIDAVAPAGFEDLPGPCIVEVKYKPHLHTMLNYAERLKRIDFEYSSILFIIDTSKDNADRFRSHLEHRQRFQVPFRILSSEDVQVLAKKHPDIALSIDRKYFDEALSHFEQKDPDQSRGQYIASLRAAYRSDQLVLFLGSGVSNSAGLPTWPELLNRLALNMIRKHPGFAAASVPDDLALEYFTAHTGSSPLITARLLRDNMGDFARQVRDALYQTYSSHNPTQLVEEIGTLATPPRGRPGLVAIVTYNYDDLVETELSTRNLAYHVIITEEATAAPNELPIYHPHGYLPRSDELLPMHEAALVLSEDAYHLQFIDPYSWPNITQLNLLRNHTCVFVGLSMTDPNLRRLLEISQSKKPGVRHYAILVDKWSDGHADPTLTRVGKVFRGLEESTFRKLGINIVWAKRKEDVPSILSEIRR